MAGVGQLGLGLELELRLLVVGAGARVAGGFVFGACAALAAFVFFD